MCSFVLSNTLTLTYGEIFTKTHYSGILSSVLRMPLHHPNFILTYKPRKRGNVRVRIAPRHHNRSLNTAKQLARDLFVIMQNFRTVIVDDEYQINIFSTGPLKGVLCIETNISYTVPEKEILDLLEDMGFGRGFEPVVS